MRRQDHLSYGHHPAARPAGTAGRSTAEAVSAAAVTIEILSTTTPQEKLLRIEVQVGEARRARTAEPILETAICGDPRLVWNSSRNVQE